MPKGVPKDARLTTGFGMVPPPPLRGGGNPSLEWAERRPSAILPRELGAEIPALSAVSGVISCPPPRIDILRFADLVGDLLFERRRLTAIGTPPPVNPNRKRDKSNPNQMAFCYA